MTTLFGLAGSWHTTLFTIAGFLFVLTIVVVFHELGHFLAARWCGVGVTTFSFCMGREIVGFTDGHGTRWKVGWIPIGGYVKFIDDTNAASTGQRPLETLTEDERKQSFQGKSLAARAAIVAAGPIASFLLGIAIFTAVFTFFGERTTAAKVDIVNPGSAAERAGFKPGDVVISIDGQSIENFGEMQQIVAMSPHRHLHFVVKRGEQQVELVATPELKEITDNFGNTMRIGLLGIQRSASPEDWTLERHDPLTALGMAVKKCFSIITQTFNYIRDVVTKRQPADQLSGPIRIAQLSGQMAQLGILPLLTFAALVSISIGMINLLPIPILDGGHLLLYGIEAVRGKPLSENTQEIGFRIGLAFVLMLMIFATWNDLIHLKFL